MGETRKSQNEISQKVTLLKIVDNSPKRKSINLQNLKTGETMSNPTRKKNDLSGLANDL